MMFPIVNQKEIAIANFISNGNPITKHIPAAVNENEPPATNIELLKRSHRIMNELDMTHYTSNELREKGYGNKVINIR